MKNNSEKGSALLITILMITVFSLLGLMLLTLTINSAKQVQISESKFQSTNLAEMGIVYYYTILEDLVSETALAVEASIKQAIQTDFEQDNLKSANEYEQDATLQFFYLLKEKLENNPRLSTNKTVYEQYLFQIEETEIDNETDYTFVEHLTNKMALLIDENLIEIRFVSKGNAGEVVDTIELSYKYKLSDITITADEGTAPQPANLIFQVQNPENRSLKSCSNNKTEFKNADCLYETNTQFYNKIEEIRNSTIKLNGNTRFHEINNMHNATLYINGDGTFTNTLNTIQNTTIHITNHAAFKTINNFENNTLLEVGGNLSVQEPINNFKKATIKVKGNASFKAFNNLETNSVIEVGKDLIIEETVNNLKNTDIKVNGSVNVKSINDFKNSTIEVGQNLTLTEPLNHFENSTMSVYGDATIKGINNGKNSKVCVFGSLNQSFFNNSSSVDVFVNGKTDETTFKNQCGSVSIGDGGEEGGMNSIEFNWSPTSSVEYK